MQSQVANVTADSVNVPFAKALFDAVILLAHATQKVLADKVDFYDGTAVTEAVRNLRGIETEFGPVVELDEHGDPSSSYKVTNYILGKDNVLRRRDVGLYNSSRHEYAASDSNGARDWSPITLHRIVWPGNITNTPKDYAAPRSPPGMWYL